MPLTRAQRQTGWSSTFLTISYGAAAGFPHLPD